MSSVFTSSLRGERGSEGHCALVRGDQLRGHNGHRGMRRSIVLLIVPLFVPLHIPSYFDFRPKLCWSDCFSMSLYFSSSHKSCVHWGLWQRLIPDNRYYFLDV
jgi:hypothetical protein